MVHDLQLEHEYVTNRSKRNCYNRNNKIQHQYALKEGPVNMVLVFVEHREYSPCVENSAQRGYEGCRQLSVLREVGSHSVRL